LLDWLNFLQKNLKLALKKWKTICFVIDSYLKLDVILWCLTNCFDAVFYLSLPISARCIQTFELGVWNKQYVRGVYALIDQQKQAGESFKRTYKFYELHHRGLFSTRLKNHSWKGLEKAFSTIRSIWGKAQSRVQLRSMPKI
jgi:hypothetical protein